MSWHTINKYKCHFASDADAPCAMETDAASRQAVKKSSALNGDGWGIPAMSSCSGVPTSHYEFNIRYKANRCAESGNEIPESEGYSKPVQ